VKILVATASPYGKIGGGETFYRKLVKNSPEDKFYFFEGIENLNPLPPNVTLLRRNPALKFKRVKYLNILGSQKIENFIQLNQVEKSAIRNALMIGEAIKDLEIDHIHVPEYELVGGFLNLVLKEFQMSHITTSTFLHGGLSRTMRFRNNVDSLLIERIAKIETEQRNAVDQVYAFSGSNLTHIEVSEKITFIDPAVMIPKIITNKKLTENLLELKKPILILAGRYEEVKGFERILNLYPYLSRHFLGIQIWNNSNTDQDLEPLLKMAKRRGFNLEVYRPKSKSSFFAEFPKNGLLVIPSLFDNLNLMALEAMALGIPLVISKNAGASNYLLSLDDNFKKFIFDPELPVSILSTIVWASKNFSVTREFTSLMSNRITGEGNCKEIIRFKEVESRNQPSFIQMKLSLGRIQFRYRVARILSNSILHRLNLIKSRFTLKLLIRGLLQIIEGQITPSTRMVAQDYLKWLKVNHRALRHIPFMSKVKGLPIIYGRDYTFSLLRDEAILAEDFETALTYELRLVRNESYWEGPKFNLAIELAKVSKSWSVLQVFDENPANELSLQKQVNDSNNLGDDNSRLNFRKKLLSKNTEIPTLEIVVSSYMARDKLLFFLTKLSMDELVSKGEAQVIFIDADSPQLDFEYAFSIAENLGISMKSFKMEQRVSIQEAWNFAILESTAPYLVFLGTDEACFPGNFENAIAQLTQNQGLDWITYSSFASEVDSTGNHIADKMSYDRSDYGSSVEYLDSSYINFVGGVLKRTIFERFGLFDGSFKGAGDTEFKSRVLPFIKVACSSKVGGQFFDYPENRTTASKKSEIEDFSAWYYFRNCHALQRLGKVRLECLLEIYEHALNYRKSYAQHRSTDIFLAARVLEVYKDTNLEDAGRVVKSQKLYEKIFSASKGQELLVIIWTFKLAKLLRAIRKTDSWSKLNSVGAIRLDNSLEQHGWIW
jgi:glycosyltransferase involved in cell wall biosynthesis